MRHDRKGLILQPKTEFQRMVSFNLPTTMYAERDQNRETYLKQVPFFRLQPPRFKTRIVSHRGRGEALLKQEMMYPLEEDDAYVRCRDTT